MKEFFGRVKLFSKAVRGNADAQYEFGKDTQTTVWLERAAKKGNVEALYTLGERYEAGDVGLKGYVKPGSTKNPEKALELYEKAATNGHVDAMCNVAQLSKDDVKAVRYFQAAADKGSARGKIGLGGFHAGFYAKELIVAGIDKNPDEALRLFNEVADDKATPEPYKEHAKEAIERFNSGNIKAVTAEPAKEAAKPVKLTVGEKIKARFESHEYNAWSTKVQLGQASAKQNPLHDKQSPFSGEMPGGWAESISSRTLASKSPETLGR